MQRNKILLFHLEKLMSFSMQLKVGDIVSNPCTCVEFPHEMIQGLCNSLGCAINDLGKV